MTTDERQEMWSTARLSWTILRTKLGPVGMMWPNLVTMLDLFFEIEQASP